MSDPLEISEDDLLDAEIDAMEAPPAPQAAAKVVIEPAMIMEDLPAAAYHADLTSVGAGGLRDVGRSPLHHWWAHRRPGCDGEPPTPSQRLGTAIHVAVLEPELFRGSFAVAPAVDRRTREGKAAYEAFLEEANGRAIITAADYATAEAISVTIRSSKLGSMFFDEGCRTEVSVYWSDKETGVRCRMRPDLVPKSHPVLVDLKSCTNAGDAKFRNSAWDYGYHVSAAWYVDGWLAATGEKRDYVWAAWEKDEPYASAWYYASDELLEAGRAEYGRLLKIYAECLAKDEWPGYPQMLQPMYAPPWAADKVR